MVTYGSLRGVHPGAEERPDVSVMEHFRVHRLEKESRLPNGYGQVQPWLEAKVRALAPGPGAQERPCAGRPGEQRASEAAPSISEATSKHRTPAETWSRGRLAGRGPVRAQDDLSVREVGCE